MKKKIKLLMVFLLTFTVLTINVYGAPTSTDNSANASGGASTGSGTGSGCMATGSGVIGQKCTLTNAAGMRVSVLYKNADGTYTVIKSRTFLQKDYGHDGAGRTYVGQGKVKVKMAVNYSSANHHWGTRYEYLNGATPNWTEYDYPYENNNDNKAVLTKNGIVYARTLTKGFHNYKSGTYNKPYYLWTHLQANSNVNSSGTAVGGYNYKAVQNFSDLLAVDKNKNLNSPTESVIYNFLTAPENVQVDLKDSSGTVRQKIFGMGLNGSVLKGISCSTHELFVVAEPMFTLRNGSDRNPIDYFGTATELGLRVRSWSGEDNMGRSYWYMLGWDGGHITKNHDVGRNNGILWTFPMKEPYKQTCTSYACKNNKGNGRKDSFGGYESCKRNGYKNATKKASCLNWRKTTNSVCNGWGCVTDKTNKYGVGVVFDWIGWLDLCVKCYKPVNKVSQQPSCSDTDKRTVTISQEFEEDSTCGGITDTEARNQQAMKYHKNGVLVGKTVGTYPNYCGVYCKDQAVITYPARLENAVFLNPVSTGQANGTATWPDLNTHKLSVTVNRTCQIDAEGSASKDACKSKMDELVNNSGTPFVNFTFDYNDGCYGKVNNKSVNIPLKVYNSNKPVKNGDNLTYSTDIALTGLGNKATDAEIRQTYSVYDMKLNRYIIKPGSLQKYQRYLKSAQLAFCEKSLNTGNESGTKSNPNNNNMNINTVQIGYKDNILTKDVSINKYTCKYDAAINYSCHSCTSRRTHKDIDVCCLGPTEAQAYDTYCENGYLKEEYDKVYNENYDKTKAKEDLKKGILNVNTMENACSCTNPNNGETYNMFDDTLLNNKDERTCMSTYYSKNKTSNTLDSWLKAYQYCIGVFEREGGSCSKPATPSNGTCPEDAQKNAGKPIPDGETQETWCTCATCYNACVCPARSDLAYTYITSIATRLLEEGKAKDYDSACKLAKNTSCSNGSGSPGGSGGGTSTVNASENYLYHTIDLTNPFVESSLVVSSSDTQNRLPGSNWTSTVQNNETTLTTKYITSKSNIYNNNKPLYTIDLTPSVTSAVRNYNKNNDYSDFTLNCDDNTGLCKSTFLGKTVSVSGTMANQNFQNLNRLVKQNKEGK